MSEKESQEQRHSGRILKEAREAQGLSLDTVHAATKIPMDALKSIEEGYKVRTLTPFYIKGFIKMYAQYLNVDLAKVFNDYRPEQLPPHIPDARDESPLDRLVVGLPKERQKLLAEILGGLILLAIVFKLVSFIWVAKTHPKRVKGASVVSTEKKKTPSPRRAKTSGTTVKKGSETSKISQRATMSPAERPKGVVTKATPAAVAVLSEDEKQLPAAEKNVRLTIRAKKSGWLQVKADGNIVFQSTLEEGTTESWNAEKMIELSGKNIHNLEFELNGKVLGGLGREDRSARRVVVTSEGLSVKSTL